MILAAGLGTRLRPLTLEIPKPVVPVLGRPLCGYGMEFLRSHGATAFLLNLHHGPDAVRKRVDAWAAGRFPVEYVVEPEILGTGGGIRNAREFLRGGTFLAANSDVIARFPLDEALSRHRETGALATLVLLPDPAKRYTPVHVREDGRIAGFGEEAPARAREGFFTGYQIVEPELIGYIPPERYSCIIRETYAPLVARGAPIFAFLPPGGPFLDFGAPADYLEGVVSLLAVREDVDRVFVAPGAVVDPTASVGPDAAIEDGATVGAGAAVRRAILWPGAHAAPGAVVENGILTPSRFVPA
jgi:NDP-sugar pyrophosphorylase family protein